MSRLNKSTLCGLLIAIVTVCAVPAVLACIPSATGATMEMSEVVVDVTQELPGGG